MVLEKEPKRGSSLGRDIKPDTRGIIFGNGLIRPNGKETEIPQYRGGVSTEWVYNPNTNNYDPVNQDTSIFDKQ